MSDARLVAAALLTATALLALRAAAEPAASPSAPLPVEADWRARSEAWFTAKDEPARRQEMRAVTRALRQPCRYCHTPDFTGYTDKRLISQQMMALSAEHGVTCAECHAGRDGLTPLGQRAAPMWALAREKETFCGTCHVKHRRFEALTPAGDRFAKAEWPAWREAHGVKPPPKPGTPAPGAPPSKTAPPKPAP